MSEDAKVARAEWHGPFGDSDIKVFNSLTGQLEKLVPMKPNQLSWYICGPTVYDSAHLGHARAYLTFDLIRRTLTDYFGFAVNYVMNVTDLDDKIILRARKNHLINQFKQQQLALTNQSVARQALINQIEAIYAESLQKFNDSLSKLTAECTSTTGRQKADMNERIEQEKRKRRTFKMIVMRSNPH